MNEDEMTKEELMEHRIFNDLKKICSTWEEDKIPREFYINRGVAMFIGTMFLNSPSSELARDALKKYIEESYECEPEINELKKQKEANE